MKMQEHLSAFSEQELRRYARHLVMPEVGAEGQRRMKEAAILIVGVGGLGSPAAYYLAAAGVGRIGLVDFDKVEFANLHRQILHFTTDVGRTKLESASEKLRSLNPDIDIELYETALKSDNALDIVKAYDIVLDGTDNFPTRYLVNDACVLLGKPNVYGSIFRFEGQASVFWAERGPCYRCLYPHPPPPGEVPNCAEAGVLGVLPGLVGTIQATEALKLILGKGEPLIGTLLTVDTLSMEFRRFEVQKDANCHICGQEPTIRELIDYELFCGVGPPGESIAGVPQLTVQELGARLRDGDGVILLDVREPHELRVSRLDPCVHIPMDDVPERLNELNKDDEILVLCSGGRRSQAIAEYLLEQGFKSVKNVAGGINAYAVEVDDSMPTY
ncbi:MAG: molybdopterin-synthase adenylyltransferase MoeB [Armatimonadetes bacterium]|nr:molybdopterin-synthase adenylyltransferase MoeB [Armatimonadota bacterium]